MYQAVASSLFTLAIFWAATVCGSPVPPAQEAEWFQQYLRQLAGQSNVDTYAYLHQQALHAPVRAPGAPHAGAPLHQGSHLPPFQMNPPPYVNGPHTAPVYGLRSNPTDSTLVSAVPPEARMVHDADASPYPVIYENTPIGIPTGPTAYGGAYHALANPVGDHRPFYVPFGGGETSTSHWTPSQSNHFVSPEIAADASRRLPPTAVDPSLVSREPAADASVTSSESVADPSEPAREGTMRASKRVRGSNVAVFRTVVQLDSAVDKFIATLRSRVTDSVQEAAHNAEEFNRVEPPLSLLMEPHSFAIKTFYRRRPVEELYMPGSNGERRIIITYIGKPDFLSHSPSDGHVSVWGIGPPTTDTLWSIIFYGFYPFTFSEFEKLAIQPEFIDRKWMTVRHRKGGLSVTLKAATNGRFDAAPMQDSERAVGPMQQEGHPSHFEPLQEPTWEWPPIDVNTLRVLRFIYREDPKILDLMRSWFGLVGLPSDAVTRIQLDEGQSKALSSRISAAFRTARQVKLVTLDTGASLMLCFHQTLKWLDPNKEKTFLTVWSFGRPKKLLQGVLQSDAYAVGVFYSPRTVYTKLKEGVIPGLKDMTFKDNQFVFPETQSS